MRLLRICLLHRGSLNYLASFLPNSKMLMSYDVKTETSKFFLQDLPFQPPGYPEGNLVFFSDIKIFYCGEWVGGGEGTILTHTYDFEREEQERKADMIHARNQHAMAVAEEYVYVFGGYNSNHDVLT